jgi:hypothetical protein
LLRVIVALVPLARMSDCSDKVRSLIQGRAGWTMEPHAYAPAHEEVLRSFMAAILPRIFPILAHGRRPSSIACVYSGTQCRTLK